MTCNRPQAPSEIVAAIEQSLPPDPRLGDLVDVLGDRAGGILLVAIVPSQPSFQLLVSRSGAFLAQSW